ncbi:MAG: tRNA uridine-5-carboxymethylaminomethyl(34) synthesis GTPase MnmE [Calditrichaeota bacterium]|nr:MAG: tRNA uridine-5-carboxymethylaminomethyl(34) synthesis GTPase MnmE [Calditrichota bacterium]MBL1205459.1 tRNA uridine-5-carboxymethylaminomethyl(34) synthesis GTPase MnmE [Calditrichota bacterium]NOG45288.1 tRNA uridine-5-carboxymethylaminomethyl(34) synthesis GTPase MnmE [Calditrichota bacterium]
MYEKDTIIAPISSVSGGSVSLIRISGIDAINISDVFFPTLDITEKKGGTFYFTKFISNRSDIVDEVMVYVFKGPKSYTGEDVIEISCHGNVFIVEEILQNYLSAGCRIAKPGEFSQRAFLNGKMDLTQAEAVADIIASKSKSAVKNSLQALEGKLSEKVSSLKQYLIDIGSLLELGLDFSEEDIEIVSNEQLKTTLIKTLSEITILLNSFSNSRQFQKGIEVLIAGKPNVGKSSLMNALLEKDRVIVSHIPGTTRDHIHEDIIIDDTLIRLIDTAGIRFTKDQIEAEGVNKTKRFLNTADIILAIFDISKEIENDDEEIINHITKEMKDRAIFVGNKNDKKTNEETVETLKKYSDIMVSVSAKNDNNIDELRKIIASHITKENNHDPEHIVISNERHFNILNTVKNQISTTIDSFDNEPGHEFIAMDIRAAINTLSEITGEITTDDILNNIFSNFCIGK